MPDLDVDKLLEATAQAIASLKQPQFHGQLCPVWVNRRKGIDLSACNCWIMPRARKQARLALAAIAPVITEQVRNFIDIETDCTDISGKRCTGCRTIDFTHALDKKVLGE